MNGSTAPLSENIPCTLEILSPVHIGNGVKLRRDFDFYTTNDSTYIVPQSVLMDYLRKYPEDLQKFNDPNFKPLDLLIKIPKNNVHRYNVPCRAQDLHEFERDGFARPYIPGSSIKGALRTLLFEDKLSEKNEEEVAVLLSQVKGSKSGQGADGSLTNAVFGNKPNHTSMRILSVSDAQFRKDDIELAHIKILNLSNEQGTRWAWKKAGQNDMEIFAETLAMGTQGKFTLRIDKFLFENDKANQELGFAPISQKQLFEKINHYSAKTIERELKYFERLNDAKLNELLDDLDAILGMIPEQGTPKETTECVFRLGWGSGWKSMTGDWMNDADLKAMRDKFKLGKFTDRERTEQFPIFPKTRKIIMDNGPLTVTGWVKMTTNK